jgi:hypothetical protein
VIYIATFAAGLRLFRQPRVVVPCAAALVAVTAFLAVGGWASVWALVGFAVVAGYVWLRRGPEPGADPAAEAAELAVPAETETPGAPRV